LLFRNCVFVQAVSMTPISGPYLCGNITARRSLGGDGAVFEIREDVKMAWLLLSLNCDELPILTWSGGYTSETDRSSRLLLFLYHTGAYGDFLNGHGR
jgi:hypothetical protein